MAGTILPASSFDPIFMGIVPGDIISPMKRQHPLLALTAACGLADWLSVPPAAAQEDHKDHDHGTETLGRVHFPITCKLGTQAAFDRAVALLHSFGYDMARRAFTA